MDNSSEHADVSVPSARVSIYPLIDSLRDWLDSFLNLVVLEGKKAGIGPVLMLGFGVGVTVLSIAGWLALIGCVVAAL